MRTIIHQVSKKVPALLASLFAIQFGAINSPAAPVTLLNDNFTESSRTLPANLPTSTPWYDSGASSGLTLDTTNHVLNFNGGGQFFVGSFTAANSPQTLTEIGASLSVHFTFTLTGSAISANGLRIGLFNSGGNQVHADNGGLSSTTYASYSGYVLYTDPGVSSTNQNVMNKVSLSSGNVALMTGSRPTGFAWNNAAHANLASGTSYEGIFTVTKLSATSSSVSISLGGLSWTVTDSSSPFSSFDTFAILGGSSAFSNMAVSNISAIYTVPEPSSCIYLGLASLIFLPILWRRRRKSTAS